jgi:hypothetical protein
VKPGDLKIGDRIACTVGALIVDSEPFVDIDTEPEFDRVWVDVRVENPGRFGDPDDLPAATGGETFQWLGSTPQLRYRLYFTPDTEVAVERA